LFRHLLLQTGGANIAEAAYFVVARRREACRLTPFTLLAPLAEAGACEPLPSSLARRRKACLLPSLVQDSGAPASLSTAARDPLWLGWEYAEVGSPFGSPELWRHDDLIGVSRVFDEELALAAYECGAFPMPAQPGLMGWYSPLERAILPLDGMRVSRSLRKSVRHYQVRIDTAFDDVLDGCADRKRPSGWINREIRRVYRRLFKRGVVHSVETWTPDGQLAGGLYGVSIGGLFAGESMFYRPGIGRDASKVALVALVNLLRRAGAEDRLLDVQWLTPHLESLGAVALPRQEYLSRLEVALRLPAPDWSSSSA
jgi:leucyl/phenylalanyl-tRNA--protein transferase